MKKDFHNLFWYAGVLLPATTKTGKNNEIDKEVVVNNKIPISANYEQRPRC